MGFFSFSGVTAPSARGSAASPASAADELRKRRRVNPRRGDMADLLRGERDDPLRLRGCQSCAGVGKLESWKVGAGAPPPPDKRARLNFPTFKLSNFPTQPSRPGAR